MSAFLNIAQKIDPNPVYSFMSAGILLPELVRAAFKKIIYNNSKLIIIRVSCVDHDKSTIIIPYQGIKIALLPG